MGMGAILGIHAVVAIIVCFQANQVFIKEDSPLSTARLLRRTSPPPRPRPPR